MSTLLIELRSPQQAWGSRSRFATRATELSPTKSGVIGMLAAALGLERTAALDRFEALRFGVRLDQPGRLERDFQTARSLNGSKAFPLSQRFYLADAVFLAGIESSDDAELQEYRRALARPYFPLFLGRRAFPPAGPLDTEIVDMPLLAALAESPWRAREHHRRSLRGDQTRLEILMDAQPGDERGESQRDVPVSFDPRRRQYEWRDVTATFTEVPNPDGIAPSTSDPTAEASRAPVRPQRVGLLGMPTDHDAESLVSEEEV